MDCRDVLELVEPIAAGDATADALVRAHFATCPRCAAALASARRVELALAARLAPAAPERFTSSVLQAVRRERWRAEQRVDQLFNLSIAAAVVLVVGGVLAIINLGTVLAFAASTWEIMSEGSRTAVKDAAPAMTSYIAAAGLLLSALGMWWWAERRMEI